MQRTVCVCVCVCVCVRERDAGADAADGGYLWQTMWILWMTSSLSSHSTSASVSELSRLVTHTAVSSPKCNSEKRPLSNSVAFQTLFKWHRYCGILKIHIVRKINTGIRYEPVYRPALGQTEAAGYHGSTGPFQDQYQSQYEITTQTYSIYSGMKPKYHTNICLTLPFCVYPCSPCGNTGIQVISSSKRQRGGHHLMPVCKPCHMKSQETSDCP